MLALLKKPWLHFILIGICVYAAQRWQQEPQLIAIDGPTTEKIAELSGQWLRSTGRAPTEQQLQQLVENEINQEILFQEALSRNWHLTDTVVRQRLIRDIRFLDPDTDGSDNQLIKQALFMGLHQNDLVVRRRLIQRMEMLAYAPIRRAEPDEQILQTRFEQQSANLMRPGLLHFQHVFLSRDRHSDALLKAQELLQKLQQSTAEGAVAGVSEQGDPFLHGLRFERLSEKQLSRYFGVEFAAQLFEPFLKIHNEAAADRGLLKQWWGPIRSSYGQHIVWVDQFQAATPKSFDEVRKQLLAQWRREQEQLSLQTMLSELRKEYVVKSVSGEAADA